MEVPTWQNPTHPTAIETPAAPLPPRPPGRRRVPRRILRHHPGRLHHRPPQLWTWCEQNQLHVFEARRPHIELYVRSLEDHGYARSTIGRRLSTVASFYKWCVDEELLVRNPAANVRRPKISQDSTTLGLDRQELGQFLVEAGLAGGRDHALACLLGLNGLRVSEACNASIENMGFERGHHTLIVDRKGGKRAIIPLAPRTHRALTLAIDERTAGPILLGADGGRLDRFAAYRIVRRIAKRAGVLHPRPVPTLCDMPLSPLPSTPASPSETSKKQPATATHGPPAATTDTGSASTGTPPTPWQPSSLAPLTAAEACRAPNHYCPHIPWCQPTATG